MIILSAKAPYRYMVDDEQQCNMVIVVGSVSLVYVVVSHVLVELSDVTFERREMRGTSAVRAVSVNKRVRV